MTPSADLLYMRYVSGLWEPPDFDGRPGPDRVDAPDCSPAEVAALNAVRWRGTGRPRPGVEPRRPPGAAPARRGCRRVPPTPAR